jgi:DNA-binding GntR family transcriptional regulator
VTERTPEPPGRRVEADLRTRLDAGEWASGQRLPSVAELAGHYHVAKNTVLRVLRKLETDGLVEVVPNWGTFRKQEPGTDTSSQPGTDTSS